ncbi:ABC transporter substrate-binding protein [Pikeienuella sp. HZG-20]|uniref:ABC transporter substrate-binding protein n=1 Tax=Paludibacillus litoralis TaxID=3133267 RepID=UPI0030EE3CCE
MLDRISKCLVKFRRLPTAAAVVAFALPAFADSTTLRIAMNASLGGIDPVFNTATYARDHGYLVYDQLFALDSEGNPQPQMVGDYSVSDDGLEYSFTLREGLRFHDGAPVEAEDAVASILRWKDKDTVGRTLFRAGAKLEVVDEKTFTLTLEKPFGLVLDAMARSTANALFVMPKEVAATPASEQITSAVGSGPFIFDSENWRPGDKAVYRRNPDYVPRDEPADGLAGGKRALVDVVEWVTIPDANTAVSALIAGEIDVLEQPPLELYPMIEATPGVRLEVIDPNGRMVWIRPNHLNPPLDDPRARRAILLSVNQKANMQAVGAQEGDYYEFCGAYFLCGTPLETSAGAEGLGAPQHEAAQALLNEMGYDGEEIVLLQATDAAANSAATLVLADGLRKSGFNVKLEAMDWGTLSQRRNVKDIDGEGAWHLFITTVSALDAGSPLVNPYLASPCPNSIAGFSCSEELEAAREAWWSEPDADKRRELLDAVQIEAYKHLPYINGGQWRTFAAVQESVQGIRPITVPVFWGVSKSE